MTVVSAMKFNAEEGAIIADEQSSNGRTYNFATKVRTCEGEGVSAIYGGSGAADVLYDIDLRLRDVVEKNRAHLTSTRQIASALAQVMGNVKRDLVNAKLQGLLGLTEGEVQTGTRVVEGKTLPLVPWTTDQYLKIVNSDSNPLINNGMVVLAKDKRIEIYSLIMESTSPLPIARPYHTIGSGSDTADNELHDFVARIPREQRENINPLHGLAALLYSTDRAAMRNLGVGGTPLLKIVKGDTTITPGESDTRLAMEIVRAQENRLLTPEFRDDALHSLLYGTGQFEAVDHAMWQNTSDSTQLSKLLRGYK
jgi:hypothetical protein